MRKRTSAVWRMGKKSFQELVKRNDSYVSILKELGYSGKGGSGITLRQRIKEEKIDCSHIQKNNYGKKFPDRKSIPLEKVMIKNSTYSRSHLKKRLIRDGILENKCNKCGILNEWGKEELVMVLDHINGINNDHRLDNLTLLCPNCNSQTPTFAGRKLRKYHNCEECNKEIFKKSKLCKSCNSKQQKRKVKDRPSKEQLLLEIKELGYCGTGRKYGVSDNAVRKWLK